MQIFYVNVRLPFPIFQRLIRTLCFTSEDTADVVKQGGKSTAGCHSRTDRSFSSRAPFSTLSSTCVAPTVPLARPKVTVDKGDAFLHKLFQATQLQCVSLGVYLGKRFLWKLLLDCRGMCK